MQGIEFETDQSAKGGAYEYATPKTSWPVRLLMKIGVKDRTTANFITLGVVAILLGFTFFLYAGLFESKTPSQEELDQISAQIRSMQPLNFR